MLVLVHRPRVHLVQGYACLEALARGVGDPLVHLVVGWSRRRLVDDLAELVWQLQCPLSIITARRIASQLGKNESGNV